MMTNPNVESIEKIVREFCDRYLDGEASYQRREANFLHDRLTQFQTTLLSNIVAEIEKKKRTDDCQMSDDHSFDEGIDIALSILSTYKGEPKETI